MRLYHARLPFITPCLRLCPSKIQLKKISRGTLMVAAFFVAATCMTASAPAIKDNFAAILAELPQEAIPFSLTKTKNLYKTNFETAYKEFASVCPRLPEQETDKESLAAWILENIDSKELNVSSVDFRDRAYQLATTLSNSGDKGKLLLAVSKTLPDSQILIDYLSVKRFEIARILQDDPEIIYAYKNWNKIADTAYKTLILQRVSDITLNALLPHKDIEYPKVRWISTGMSDNEFGYYRSKINEIHINGQLDPSRYTFQFALDIVMHETTHAFQDILISYGLDGHFKNNHDLDRYVSIMFANRQEDAGAIRFDKDDATSQLGYHLMKTESMAWGFARVGQVISRPHLTTQKLGNLTDDMYTKIDIVNPQKTLPEARLVASLPQRHENPFKGSIPKNCQ